MMPVDKLHFVIMPPLSSRSMPLTVTRGEAEVFVQWAFSITPIGQYSIIVFADSNKYSKQHVNLTLFIGRLCGYVPYPEKWIFIIVIPKAAIIPLCKGGIL